MPLLRLLFCQQDDYILRHWSSAEAERHKALRLDSLAETSEAHDLGVYRTLEIDDKPSPPQAEQSYHGVLSNGTIERTTSATHAGASMWKRFSLTT